MDLQKTIAEADLQPEDNEQGNMISESEAEQSLSRYGSFSSSQLNRRFSSISKMSNNAVIEAYPYFIILQ